MAGRLDGKVALITGAGSVGPGWGNGRATAMLFAREGARVVAVDRNTAAAEATRQMIESEGNACAVETADVTDSAQIERVMSEVCEHWGGLHVLVNNVGARCPAARSSSARRTGPGNWSSTSPAPSSPPAAPSPSWRRRARALSSTSPRSPGSASSATTTRPMRRRRRGWCSSPRRWPFSTRRAACAATPSPSVSCTPRWWRPGCRPIRRGRPGSAGRQAPRQVPMGRMGSRLGRGPRGALPGLGRGGYVTAADLVVDGGLTAKCD